MSEQQPQPAAAPAYPGGAYLGQHQGNAIFEARFKKHTGLLLMSQTRTFTVRGTLDQVQAVYRSAQTHNLLAGWWGIFSLVVLNPVAGRNSSREQRRQH